MGTFYINQFTLSGAEWIKKEMYYFNYNINTIRHSSHARRAGLNQLAMIMDLALKHSGYFIRSKYVFRLY